MSTDQTTLRSALRHILGRAADPIIADVGWAWALVAAFAAIPDMPPDDLIVCRLRRWRQSPDAQRWLEEHGHERPQSTGDQPHAE